MDREIKFRGRRKNNGGWVYGDLMTKYIHHEGLTIVEGGCVYNEVDPETVGQFINLMIGLEEFYEGDICRDRNGKIFVIEYFSFSFEAWYPETDSIESLLKLGEIEKLGNIHDNPEFLKEGIS